LSLKLNCSSLGANDLAVNSFLGFQQQYF